MGIARSLPVHLALLASAIVVAGCSSDSTTGPTTATTAQLILHFDSLANMSSGLREQQYRFVEEALAYGSPVATGSIALNGVTQRYSLVANNTVEHNPGGPGAGRDSDVVVIAWRGDASDTVLAIDHGEGEFNLFLTTPTVQIESPGAGSTTESPFIIPCISFASSLPPGSEKFFIPALECRRETIAVLAHGVLTNGADTVNMVLPAQRLAGIRVEINIFAQ